MDDKKYFYNEEFDPGSGWTLATGLTHALRKLNYDLKQLAAYCGIKLNVSSYTSRHTWATLAKYCHFSEQLICDALGHSSTKVTETYLKSFKNDELDKANKVIINHINISI